MSIGFEKVFEENTGVFVRWMPPKTKKGDYSPLEYLVSSLVMTIPSFN